MEPGAVIEGKYEILAKLREGGMGTIYKVRHRLLDEVRVVKVMQKHVVESAELRSRFIDEAKMATRLKHPNLGTIHDFALADDGTAYLVMEFIDGVTLRDLLVNQGLPPVLLSLEIAHQTLMALSYLHKKNIVHRDIAPDNLMLMHDEEGQPHIKVIDLGIAKTLDRQSGLTSTGVFLGKLSYASPEMFGSLDQGERLDGRSDLYSLGVVLYELLTGHKPISADGPARLLRAHLIDPPMAFEQSDPENRVPAEVRAVILKALEKRRGNRYASADEFDGDVVKLIRMFSSAEDHEGTKKIISGIHAIPASGGMGTPTPSAQDRLNRQFGVATPTSPPSDLDPTVRTEDMDLADAGEGRTARPTGKTGAGAGSSAPKVSRGGAKKASPIAMGLGVAAAVAIGAGGLVLFRRDAPKSPATDPSIVPTATSSSVGATPPATSPGTAASPSLPTPAPTPESKVEPTPAAATAEPTKPSAEAKASAESARSRMLKARQGAEREKAGELAPVAFRYGNEKSREAQDLFSQRQYDAARAAFDASARFFSDAENDARAEAARRKAAADRLAALPPPTHAHDRARAADADGGGGGFDGSPGRADRRACGSADPDRRRPNPADSQALPAGSDRGRRGRLRGSLSSVGSPPHGDCQGVLRNALAGIGH